MYAFWTFISITCIGGSREWYPWGDDEAEIVWERQEDREPVGDVSLQIGTKEMLPNRMWLWFLTSFHSQLSDRFLLRWHLLHNTVQKCGTVQKWGSCCPTCQPLWVTSSPLPLSCGSQQQQQQNLRCSYGNDAPHLPDASPFCSPSLFFCVFHPCSEQSWPIYLWCVDSEVSPEQTLNHSCVPPQSLTQVFQSRLIENTKDIFDCFSYDFAKLL